MRSIELRPTRLVLGLATSVLIALAPPALAGDGDGTDGGALDRASKLVRRLDTNADGTVDESEARAAREGVQRRHGRRGLRRHARRLGGR